MPSVLKIESFVCLVSAAYPLHEGPYEKDNESGEPNDRRVIYKNSFY